MFPIATLSFIIQSFFQPERLVEAAAWSKKKVFGLFFTLALIISLPFLTETLAMFGVFSQDMTRVLNRMPLFTIQGGEIETQPPLEKAIVVKTDSIVFIFDHLDQYDDREEKNDLDEAGMGLVFGSDSFTFESMQVPLTIAYEEAEGLTDGFFRSLLSRFTNQDAFSVLIIVLFSFLTGIMETAIRFLFFTLLANVLSAFMRRRFTFGDNWRMMMVAGFIPTLVFAVLNAFSLHAFGQLQLIGFVSLYLYYRGIRATPKIGAQ